MTGADRSERAAGSSFVEQFGLRRPSREVLLVFCREALWVTCLWLVVYGGANWLTGLHSYRVRLWTELELAIPFVPAAAAVYLSLFPMLWLALFVLHTPVQVRLFARALAWLILISALGFLVLPGEQAYWPQAPAGFAGRLFALADRLNLSHNYLPSLHVGMAVVSAYVYSGVVPTKAAIVFWIWAAAIAASTLLAHQHYLIDVAAGAVLGYLIASRTFPDRAAPTVPLV